MRGAKIRSDGFELQGHSGPRPHKMEHHQIEAGWPTLSNPKLRMSSELPKRGTPDSQIATYCWRFANGLR